MSSVLKSYQKYDSYSTRRSQNTSNYSYQQETQFQNTFKNNRSYLQLLQHKKEIQQRQWDLSKNTQDQLALEREIEQFKENYDKFMTTVQELTESIQDKETQKNLVVGATAFLGGILSFFTFGISAVVGGIAAYAAKEAYDSQINNLRRSKQSYQDQIQEATRMIREKKNQLSLLYNHGNDLKSQISNLRREEQYLYKYNH